MHTILTDCRYYEEICAAWGKEFHVLPSFYHPQLPTPTAAHPDMTLFSAGNKTFICAPEAYSYYQRLLVSCRVKLVQGEQSPAGHYPKDIAYNVARAGKHLFAHPSADPAILRYAEENDFLIHKTKQGYAKCSSCIVSEGALITADPSIFRTAREAGLSVLKVRPGAVDLPGYDCGFLGGASGLLPDGRLLFFGDISAHPDSRAIFDFCARFGVRVQYLKNRPLTDIGTILSID